MGPNERRILDENRVTPEIREGEVPEGELLWEQVDGNTWFRAVHVKEEARIGPYGPRYMVQYVAMAVTVNLNDEDWGSITKWIVVPLDDWDHESQRELIWGTINKSVQHQAVLALRKNA